MRKGSAMKIILWLMAASAALAQTTIETRCQGDACSVSVKRGDVVELGSVAADSANLEMAIWRSGNCGVLVNDKDVGSFETVCRLVVDKPERVYWGFRYKTGGVGYRLGYRFCAGQSRAPMQFEYINVAEKSALAWKEFTVPVPAGNRICEVKVLRLLSLSEETLHD